jgi:hypothetical protein
VQLAKRKAKVWALDANETMLAYACDKAAAAGVTVTTLHGDMSDFEVQVSICGVGCSEAAAAASGACVVQLLLAWLAHQSCSSR